MSKSTYYIVQTGPECYVVEYGDGLTGFGPADKAAHLSLSLARRACREVKRGVELRAMQTGDYSFARRFPRIVKVTVETKTIKDRR